MRSSRLSYSVMPSLSFETMARVLFDDLEKSHPIYGVEYIATRSVRHHEEADQLLAEICFHGGAFDLEQTADASAFRQCADACFPFASIEAWRQQMQLERFVLVGHSLGGFLSASYALRYPQHVAHLVLDDPWGFPVFDPGRPRGKRMGPWLAPLQLYCNRFNVLSGLRASGLLGPFIMQAALSGAHSLFGRVVTDPTAIPNYVYHCNVRRPT
ncbi:hypothetical protein HPB50_013795 [Hyalomma asiaticum]|uniref:Uncharacterized protein n=1 Tax=Hyalomma asiaticum TaxID=266040 RepID=A0ACB7TG72_HYAAI|nr:hypothetical protein HPB50_013795 [Hyalomma asiaticum]